MQRYTWGLILTSSWQEGGSSRYDGELHTISERAGPVRVDEEHRRAVITDFGDPSLVFIYDEHGELARLPRPGTALVHTFVDGTLLFSDDGGIFVAPESEDWTPDLIDGDFSSVQHQADGTTVWRAHDDTFRWLSDGDLRIVQAPGAEEFYLHTGNALFRAGPTWMLLDLASGTTASLDVPDVGFVGQTGEHSLLHSARAGLMSCGSEGECTTLDATAQGGFTALPDQRMAYLAGGERERIMVTDGVTTEAIHDSNRGTRLELMDGPEGPILISTGAESVLVSPDGTWVHELGATRVLDFLGGCVVSGNPASVRVVSLGLPGTCGDLPSGEELFAYKPSAPITSLAVHPEATDEFLVVENDNHQAALKRIRLQGRVQTLTTARILHIGRPDDPGRPQF